MTHNSSNFLPNWTHGSMQRWLTLIYLSLSAKDWVEIAATMSLRAVLTENAGRTWADWSYIWTGLGYCFQMCYHGEHGSMWNRVKLTVAESETHYRLLRMIYEGRQFMPQLCQITHSNIWQQVKTWFCKNTGRVYIIELNRKTTFDLLENRDRSADACSKSLSVTNN